MGPPDFVNPQVSGQTECPGGVDRSMVGVPAEPVRPPVSPRALALATHPGPTVAVTVVATLLALAAGVAAGRAALVCAAVLAGQASIGWSNDWLDADRDRAVARSDKPVVQGTVRPTVLRFAALVAVFGSVVLSPLLGELPGVLLLVLLGKIGRASCRGRV